MQATQPFVYTAKKFDLAGLSGISDKTLEMHFGLYEGYVKNTNLLREQLAGMRSNGITGTDPKFAELVRRQGFEYSGMRLHEFYFENLTPKPSDFSTDSKLAKAIENSFGDPGSWRKEFAAIGTMRGVGWAVLYQDPLTGELSNHWLSMHENDQVAGFTPILVMDLWEHAFLLDYKPSERAKYVEAFLSNVKWEACELRLAN
jgi:Fe-Mn family superoxide dismutase